MAKLSLKPTNGDEDSAALVEMTTHQLASIPEFFQGDLPPAQFRPPSLRIIGKTGKLCDSFPKNIGDLLYDGEIILGSSVKAVIASMKFAFEQTVPYDSDEIPLRFASLHEARQAGVEYHPTAQMTLLLEMPEGMELGEEIEGKFYAPALLYLKKYDVNKWREIIQKDAQLRFKGDARRGMYTITAELIKGKANSWYGPGLRAAGNTPPAVLDFLTNQLVTV